MNEIDQCLEGILNEAMPLSIETCDTQSVLHAYNTPSTDMGHKLKMIAWDQK